MGAGSGYRSDGFGLTGGAALQKVGARYYDPALGGFLTRDTELDQKPYGYCNCDPINFTDPDGHKSIWQTIWKGIQGILGIGVTYKGSSSTTSTTTTSYTNRDAYTNGRGGGQQLNQTSTKTTTTITRTGPTLSFK